MRRILGILLLTCFGQLASADQVSWQGYEIYYTVFNSMVIPADVAKLHNIVRSRQRIVTNITVRKDGEAVAATVSGFNRNLLSQLFQMEFDEVREPGAIYYLSNQLIDSRDHLRFELKITPVNHQDTLELRFSRQYGS